MFPKANPYWSTILTNNYLSFPHLNSVCSFYVIFYVCSIYWISESAKGVAAFASEGHSAANHIPACSFLSTTASAVVILKLVSDTSVWSWLPLNPTSFCLRLVPLLLSILTARVVSDEIFVDAKVLSPLILATYLKKSYFFVLHDEQQQERQQVCVYVLRYIVSWCLYSRLPNLLRHFTLHCVPLWRRINTAIL